MRESDEEAALLGRIAVRYGFITMEQLAEATRERGRGGKKLGAIMLERGMLDELELGKVLALQKRHREALAKKRETPKPAVRKKRIPTPKDWAFEAPRQKSSQSSLPRRERRTGDVMRDRLGTGDGKEQKRKPRALAEDSSPGRIDSRPAEDDERLEAVTRRVPDSEDGEKRSPFRRRSTKPNMPASERPDSEPPSGEAARRPISAPRRQAVTAPARRVNPEMPTPGRRTTDVPETPHESPAAKARVAPPPADLPSDDLAGIELDLDLDDGPITPAPGSNRLPDAPTSSERLATEPPSSPRLPPQPPPAGATPVVVAPTDASPLVSIPPAPFANLEPMPWDVRASDNPRVAFLHELLTHAVKSNASDVHVHAGTVARMRLLGHLAPITEKPLAAGATHEALTAILTPWQRGVFDEAGEIDFAYEVEGLSRFRANVYRQHAGTNGVFHVIPDKVPTLDMLGLPQALAKLTNYTQGLILITGPAGCGKTSTMAALTNIINEERPDHILTIEDPIEYVFESKRCIVNQRQVGRHTESFARGLRGALREDPDIICIGELRDLETISLALSAAETGHLVLATVHTGSAIGTINRIVGAYPPGQQPQVRAMMSESLRAITSQRLLPGTDGRSQVALETLFITRAVGALIRDNRTFQIGSIMQTGKSQGMRLLDDSLRELLEKGLISEDVALKSCNDPRRLGGA